MFPSEQGQNIMTNNRQEIIALIGQEPFIQILPAEQQGKYLIGIASHATSRRAVCLAWGNELEGRLTLEMLEEACHEIAQAQLNAPCLFFCRSCLVVSPDLFACMQIPDAFESRQILSTLRTMNLQGRPRPITFLPK